MRAKIKIRKFLLKASQSFMRKFVPSKITLYAKSVLNSGFGGVNLPEVEEILWLLKKLYLQERSQASVYQL